MQGSAKSACQQAMQGLHASYGSYVSHFFFDCSGRSLIISPTNNLNSATKVPIIIIEILHENSLILPVARMTDMAYLIRMARTLARVSC